MNNTVTVKLRKYPNYEIQFRGSNMLGMTRMASSMKNIEIICIGSSNIIGYLGYCERSPELFISSRGLQYYDDITNIFNYIFSYFSDYRSKFSVGEYIYAEDLFKYIIEQETRVYKIKSILS